MYQNKNKYWRVQSSSKCICVYIIFVFHASYTKLNKEKLSYRYRYEITNYPYVVPCFYNGLYIDAIEERGNYRVSEIINGGALKIRRSDNWWRESSASVQRCYIGKSYHLFWSLWTPRRAWDLRRDLSE